MYRKTMQALLSLHPACLTDPQTRALFLAWLKEAADALGATMIDHDMIIADRSPEERATQMDTLVSTILRDLAGTAATYVGLCDDDDAAHPYAGGSPDA